MEQKTEAVKTGEAQANQRLASTNEAYQSRVGNLAAADSQRIEERDEADTLEHDQHELVEEAKFVANPTDLRKGVSSEDEFSEGLSDNPVDVEVGSETVETPAAKKTPAKKTAAKR